ncbi:unnamed protein product, partial [Tetraodon nigroviridis]
MNSSTVLLTFTIYSSLGSFSLELAVCVLLLYVSGLCVNLLLVLVICADARLHRPMYVLLVHLTLSGLLGSSTVTLSLVRHLLSQAESSLSACLSQVFFTNVYGSSMFCLLALMAYDRYVSICKPLLYHAIMRPGRLRLLLALLYLLLSSSSAVQVYLTSTLPLCQHSLDKLLCDSLAISKLSCQRNSLVGLYGLCCAACVIALPCLLVLLSYCHIFSVMLKLSGESQRKALQTCTPHLVVFINFSGAAFCGVTYNRLSANIPKTVNILACVSFFLVPPLFNPIIYGIKMKEIRLSIHRVM